MQTPARNTDAEADAEGLDLHPYTVEAARDCRPHAMYNLGVTLWGAGRYAVAMKWFKRAAAVREVNALYTLGLIHMNGWGLPAARPEVARALFEAGHILGHRPCGIELGAMMVRGQGGPKRVEAGMELVRAAARAGETSGWSVLVELMKANLSASEGRDVA